MLENINKQLKEFYDNNLKSHGPGAQGVGWKNEEAQQVRFEQLAKLLPRQKAFSINDLGCGVGDFATYLQNNGFTQFSYTGYDVMEEMITLAKNKHTSRQNYQFVNIKDAENMQEADYSIASGIFNLRYANTNEEWQTYILSNLQVMHEKSRKGFAFNALTSYSDKEKMQGYLYYSDPLFLFDYCKKHFAKNVALLHDYNQYDFTILVRKVFE